MSLQRFFSLLLSFLQLFLCCVSYDRAQPPALPAAEPVRDISSDTPLSPSVLFADSMCNTVQAVYSDAKHRAYILENTQVRLTHKLTGLQKTATLTDTDGGVYVRDSFDVFYTDSHGTFRAASSGTAGRVNTVRLGLYYDECHVRDLRFSRNDFVPDKTYHMYGDRLYQQYTLYALHETTDLRQFGSLVSIPCARVRALEFRDRNGTGSDLARMDADSVEYVAFDIRDVGVIGFIIPPQGGRVTLEEKRGQYILRQFAPYTPGDGINKYDETGGYALNSVTFGCRIYTDKTHTFDGAAQASLEERTPLTIRAAGDGSFLRYDPLRGSYDVQTIGFGFSYAYTDPDRHVRIPITVQGGAQPRDIYLRATENTGCLEGAAILDENDLVSPIPVQVSKNFHGDYGEDPLYYTAMDTAYGDSFTPLRVGAEETLRCTLLHLYQNWGKVPLKQLSSIEFHVSYYHLSTGVTESNCIAPYYVYGRDGWILPDFRGCSGKMWAQQPQFNSVGVLKFMQERRGFKTLYSEYRGSRIDAVGPTYADITTAYSSDRGYTYTLRHSEMPQTDENRTYYTLDVRFDRTVAFRDLRRDLDLFYFDGRFVTFSRFGYLSAQNEPAAEDTKPGTRYITLGSENPYFDFFSVTPQTEYRLDENFGCNFGLIVRRCRIVRNGQESSIPLVLRQSNSEDMTVGALTLDADAATFRAGDSITLDLVLLPWGTGRETTDDNVRAVRQDSALQPATLTAETGQVVPDSFLPTVRCTDDEAVFSLRGGRGNVTIRADGFSSPSIPRILRQNGDGWETVELSSANGYDGVGVHYDPDGTYGFSFVVPAPGGTQSVYCITQK